MSGPIGPTGKFPNGKINPRDKGELRVSIGIEQERVVVRFGTQVGFIGMTRDEALLFAKELVSKAMDMHPTENKAWHGDCYVPAKEPIK